MKSQWKKLLVLSLAVALLGVNIKSLAEEAAESRRLSILTIKGEEAFVARAAGNEVKAVAGTPLAQGNKVRTGAKTNLYVQADNSKTIKLENNTQAEITQASSKKLKITLKSGEMFFNVDKPLESDEELTFDAAQTSMSIRGTSGIINFGENTLTFYLIEGKVGWNLGDQVLEIQAGQKVVLKREFNDNLPTEETTDIYIFEIIEPFDWKDLSPEELETVLEQQSWVDLTSIGLGSQDTLEEAGNVLGKTIELFRLSSSQKIIKVGKVTTKKSRNKSSSRRETTREESTPEETTGKEPTSLASPSDATSSIKETTKTEPETSETETTTTTEEETTRTEPETSETESTSEDESTKTEPPTSGTESTSEEETTEPIPETLYWVYYEDSDSSIAIKKEPIKDGEELPNEEPTTHVVDGKQVKGYRCLALHWVYYEDDVAVDKELIGKGEEPANEPPYIHLLKDKQVRGYRRLALYRVYYQYDNDDTVTVSKKLIKYSERPEGKEPAVYIDDNNKEIKGYLGSELYWVYYQYDNDTSNVVTTKKIEENEEIPKDKKPTKHVVNGASVLGYSCPELYWIDYKDNNDTNNKVTIETELIKYDEIPEDKVLITCIVEDKEIKGYLRTPLTLYWVYYQAENDTVGVDKEKIKDNELPNEVPTIHIVNGERVIGYRRPALYWLNYGDNINSITSTEVIKSDETLINGESIISHSYNDKDGKERTIQGYYRPLYWVYYENYTPSNTIINGIALIESNEELPDTPPSTYSYWSSGAVYGYRTDALPSKTDVLIDTP